MPNAESSSSTMIHSYVSSKERNFAPAVEQNLKGSIYDNQREPLSTVQNRVRFQAYREIIFKIAEVMNYDVSGAEARKLSNISGLSFQNISQITESYINRKKEELNAASSKTG